jgi:hypothetical protein
MCTYQETRQNTLINPKTNQPYIMPYERNQEPWVKASIAKEEIKQCLRAQKPIQNHHILFEDYRDAWKELAQETGDYAIPLLIEGGVLHAHTGGLRLGAFRDPQVKDASTLTEEERKTLGVEEKEKPITFITANIGFIRVFIDSVVIVPQENTYIGVFSNYYTYFIGTIFNKKVDFSNSIFRGMVDFSDAVFSKEISFRNGKFSNVMADIESVFKDGAIFRKVIFSKTADFFKGNI